ncbi:hypothetical protein TTHERM_000144959 (macronuclear) [Tetrahymena thermophila SB210]|uniref:Protein preY, mitochondrial n=1 Tax=Tetrahymena thermophila (strain SB210) TaxID=312017 RepID=W7X8F5_TETTS|nr:hypothetical protein TTHERM_000144959 [Tetrahymena thermophila SB210]EWS75655.1 hypothetical protein TTHERM_000144959 [Tetrahymena thermophila SB210]|eukprot:XP_012651801.1 hypothetical protein TTHERM_000144959 [Tetrahymena thermophila SB210]
MNQYLLNHITKRTFCIIQKQPIVKPKTIEFDESILKFIRCPISKQNLQYDKEKKALISDKLGIRYDLKNGIAEITPFNASI